MSPFLAECLGTLVLVLLGDGIVANAVLKQTKGHNAGWISITVGWALAVTLVFGIRAMLSPGNLIVGSGWDKGFAPAMVGLLVWSIGLSLGGTTGYAINPARDLGPRIAHALLPISGKGDSDWGYAWIPVIGPIIGGILGSVAFSRLF